MLMRRFRGEDVVLVRGLAQELGLLALLDDVLAEPDEIDFDERPGSSAALDTFLFRRVAQTSLTTSEPPGVSRAHRHAGPRSAS